MATISCHECTQKVEAKSTNMVFWQARDLGWYLIFEGQWALPDIAYCPEHSPLEGGGVASSESSSVGVLPWSAGCSTCGWEEGFATEDGMQAATRLHHCEDFVDMWPDIWSEGPQARREREAREAQEIAERRKQREHQRNTEAALEQSRAASAILGKEYERLASHWFWRWFVKPVNRVLQDAETNRKENAGVHAD